MQRRLTAISPLALLTVAACGGGGGSNVSQGPQSTTFSGNVVKGPLQNAWVFIDFNGNGTWDLAQTQRACRLMRMVHIRWLTLQSLLGRRPRLWPIRTDSARWVLWRSVVSRLNVVRACGR